MVISITRKYKENEKIRFKLGSIETFKSEDWSAKGIRDGVSITYNGGETAVFLCEVHVAGTAEVADSKLVYIEGIRE